MSQDIYYTAPSDDTFNEIRDKAIAIWRTYDDEHGYATQKIETIQKLENVRDNYMYIVGMFDPLNQDKLYFTLSKETAMRVLRAMS
jgi:hypothetical protein